MKADAWATQQGRDLDPLPIEPGRWSRIVACLNIWNDLAELRANFESWYPYVDHVIAVDGAYEGMNCRGAGSSDGTLEFLATLPKVQIVHTAFLSQVEKRTLYFKHALPGDLLWRIDADEHFENAEAIRETPHLDVGWLRYTAPIYSREQGIPAVFAWREGLHYRDRHHWVYAGDRLISTQQRGGAGLIHRILPIEMTNSRGARRPAARVQVAKVHRRNQVMQEAQASPLRVQGHEPLRIVQMGIIDPGIVIARLHSAVNTTTPHSSVMATLKDEWTKAPRQFRLKNDAKPLIAALQSADVLHLHIAYDTARRLGVSLRRWKGRTVIHHHGTMFRKRVDIFNQRDADHASLRLVSNLEMLQYAPDLVYLPNPVPFARYRQLGDAHRPAWKAGTLRIAHSPTKRENKATDVFLRVCERLNRRGLKIEPVLIERTPWRDALALKATCHATFDSFWLGMQCSGLEAAAMGQPVIAGDEDCAKGYDARYGYLPYTWANDEAAFGEVIEQLATDHASFDTAAQTVGTFVLAHHDYANVAAAYLDLLDGAMAWRRRLTIGGRPVSA